jgi:hypothetical protein
MSEPTDTNTGKRLMATAIRVVGYLIYAYLLIVEIILFLGFFLLLFGANSSSSFVAWVYRSLDRAMRPFRGIFEPIDLGTASNEVEAVFDTSVLFAMIIYGILAIALHSLLDWLTQRIDRIDRENQARAQQGAYQDAVDEANAARFTYPEQQAGTVPATTASTDPARTTPTPPPPPTV